VTSALMVIMVTQKASLDLAGLALGVIVMTTLTPMLLETVTSKSLRCRSFYVCLIFQLFFKFSRNVECCMKDVVYFICNNDLSVYM
jgi:hypothetical protein